MGDAWTCDKCGTGHSQDDVVCQACGAMLPAVKIARAVNRQQAHQSNAYTSSPPLKSQPRPVVPSFWEDELPPPDASPLPPPLSQVRRRPKAKGFFDLTPSEVTAAWVISLFISVACAILTWLARK